MATPIEWGIGALIAGGAAAAAGLSAVAATGSLAHQVNESSHKRKEKERKDQVSLIELLVTGDIAF